MPARNTGFAPRSALFAAASLLFLSLAAPDTHAMGTPPSPPEPKEPSASPASAPSAPDSAAQAAELRARAEGHYKKGWKESESAKADLKAKKPKDAAKKFARALKHFDEAVKLDPAYFEAWNMVGFCSRKTGDLKRAFDAYDKALAIRPDYDEAHEYLGEAYLMSGDVAKAKEQLAWLKEKQSAEAAELEEAIEAAEKGGAAEHAGHGDDD